MAKPRVFISSTFYDLRQIRVELDKFIVNLGFEPVRNEEGDIPYDKGDVLESYCYKEISNIDILISIIGSRYGNESTIEGERDYSISQVELKTALKENKQVFVFIDKSVFTEYETYLLNKERTDIIYKFVDNVKIYKFIEEIKSLPKNNNIKDFESAQDITSYLKEQFAGLFKKYMLDSKKMQESLVIKDIENTAKTLKELIDYLKEDSKGKKEEINSIIRLSHPIVSKLKELLGIDYNFYIEGLRDLGALLRARGYRSNEDTIDEYCWIRHSKKKSVTTIDMLYVKKDIFDQDNIKYIKPADWEDTNLRLESSQEMELDDLPF